MIEIVEVMKYVFPEEIVNHILSYTGIIKERNGKYMGQIDKKDVRYTILEMVSREIDFITRYKAAIIINKYFHIHIYTDNEKNSVNYVYQFAIKCCGEKNCKCYVCKKKYLE